MDFKSVVNLLSDRINQPHYMEYWLTKVYKTGFKEGKKHSDWQSVAEKLAQALESLKEEDWDEMLQKIPDSIEHRGCTFTCSEDFAWDDYETYIRYVAPAEDLVRSKFIESALKEYEKLKDGE